MTEKTKNGARKGEFVYAYPVNKRVVAWLEKHAKDTARSKYAIVEDALKLYRVHVEEQK